MSWRSLLLAALAAAIGGVLTVVFGYPWYQQHQHKAYMESTLPLAAPVEFDVAAGASFRKVAQAAEKQGIVADGPRLARAAGRAGKDRSIKAGRYRLEPGLSVADLLAKLVAGDAVFERFTIIEGQTLASVLAALAEDERLVAPAAAAEAFSLPDEAGGNPEGFIFPDTYLFNAGSPAAQILLEAHRRMLAELEAAWQARLDNLPYRNPYEALIMASIIEKETGAAHERQLVASVFVNRLRRGMRLQSDPTVIYGIGAEFDGNLTKKHLRTDTAYNTYTRHGLPPSPIALPGRASLLAAVNPATSDYLYFVGTGEGNHHFSKSLREHNNAVNRYQKRPRR